jgi:hypothetical protein
VIGEGPTAVLRGFFDGRDLERKQNLAAQLLTVTEDGWPHEAMVSAGEVLLAGEADVRLALWPDSRTTANVVRTGRALLVVVLDGACYRLRLSLARAPSGGADAELSFFTGAVVEVTADRATYAVLDAGVAFSLRDPGPTLARWARTTAALRGLSPGPRGR